jgi:hypothetical protein
LHNYLYALYGFYILIVGTGFVWNDWQWKIGDDFYLIAVMVAVALWIILFFMRLFRYVIEGFSSEEVP